MDPRLDRLSSVGTRPTAEHDAAELAAVRALVVDAFAGHADGEFGDDDWDHALGGLHVTAWSGAGARREPVAHASLVCRRVLHGSRTLRCGYVEAVVVRADHRCLGLGGALMGEVERLLAGYDLGALGATDEGRPLYQRRGWLPWRGRLSALTPGGVVPTPDDEGAVMVLPGETALDLDGELTCDWRTGDLW